MTEGRHSILFYNNNTEYIVFNDLTSSATATATTRTRTRAGFSELHKNERTVGQPDMLYGSYLGEYEAKPGYEAVSLPVELRPLVYTYVVRCEFSHGAQYVALARGALAGMAESVYLQDGQHGQRGSHGVLRCHRLRLGLVGAGNVRSASRLAGRRIYPGY